MICALLGANWYAVAATAGLGALVVVHFGYALWLTWSNYKARGTQRYAVTTQEPGVSWSSKNMLVLGFVVLLGLAIHLVHFLSKMMLVELLGGHETMVGGQMIHATDGAALIQYTFSQWYNVVIYLVWFVALLAFVILSSVDFLKQYSCLLFFYAIPANAIVALSLLSAWRDFRWNKVLISVIVWGALLSLHVTLLVFFQFNFWKLYLLGIPGQVAIFLWFRMYRPTKEKEHNHG